MNSGKESRRQLTGLTAWQILESIGETVAVIDRRYRLVWLKDKLLAKYRPESSVVGEYCYEVLVGRDSPCPDNCPVSAVFATGHPCVYEKQFVDQEGMEQWREARAFPIVDRQGRVAFAARIGFDITLRKRRQAHQLRDYENLERALDELNRIQLNQLPFQPAPDLSLTTRELEILRLMAQGISNPRIAGLLGISSNTVKHHVMKIFNKLGVNDRTQAAVWAARQGLV